MDIHTGSKSRTRVNQSINQSISRLIVLAVIISLLVGVGAAATLHVDDDFDNTNDTHHTTIQNAVDAANYDDTIEVNTGTYKESVTIDKNITVESTGNPGETKVNGSANGVAFRIQTNNVNGGSVVIDGFNITGYSASTTGITGRMGQSDVDPTSYEIKNNKFTDLAVGINAWGFGDYDNRVEAITISNNEFTDIGSQGEVRGAGIFLEDLHQKSEPAAVVMNNTFDSIASGSSERGIGIYFSPTSDGETEIGANAVVIMNDFTGVDVDVGVTGNVSKTFLVGNSFSSGGTGVETQGIEGGQIQAPANYWGSERGPEVRLQNREWIGEGTKVADEVEYEPFLTDADAVPEAGMGEVENTQKFAFDTLVPGDGEPYTLGFPGPVEGKVSDVFGGGLAEGSVLYEYDAENGKWSRVTGNDSIEALDAYVLIPSEDERAVIDFADLDEEMIPAEREVSSGWNFIAAPEQNGADKAFGASSASPARILGLYRTPEDTMHHRFDSYTLGSDHSPEVDPFVGYWMYAEKDGEVAANIGPGMKASQESLLWGR